MAATGKVQLLIPVLATQLFSYIMLSLSARFFQSKVKLLQVSRDASLPVQRARLHSFSFKVKPSVPPQQKLIDSVIAAADTDANTDTSVDSDILSLSGSVAEAGSLVEGLELYHKFKTSLCDSLVLTPEDKIKIANLDIEVDMDFEFDNSSFELNHADDGWSGLYVGPHVQEPTEVSDKQPSQTEEEPLDNEEKSDDSSNKENASPQLLEFSAFEPKIDYNAGIFARFINFVSTHTFHRKDPPLKSLDSFEPLNLVSPVYGDVYSPVSMRIPVKESIKKKPVDISIFHECESFCDDYSDHSIEDMGNTIRFNKFADMLVYNNNLPSETTALESPVTETTDSPQSNNASSCTTSSTPTLAKGSLKRKLSLSTIVLPRKSTLRRTASFTFRKGPKKLQSILKNKHNENFETELNKTIKDDSVNLDRFLETFEEVELEKHFKESQLSTMRLQQLTNYYSG